MLGLSTTTIHPLNSTLLPNTTHSLNITTTKKWGAELESNSSTVAVDINVTMGGSNGTTLAAANTTMASTTLGLSLNETTSIKMLNSTVEVCFSIVMLNI